MKRVKQLVPLSHEHHHGLVMAQNALRLKPDASAEQVESAWQAMKHYLQGQARHHFFIEERYLLEPLSRMALEEHLITSIYNDHECFREFAEQPVGQELAQLQTVARRLKAHIKQEEQQLFTIAQDALSAQQLEALFLAHQEQG